VRAVACGSEILRACIRAGGVLSGEHGIGIEKMNEMVEQFDEPTLKMMERMRDAIEPTGLLNPGKIFPGENVLFPIVESGAISARATGMSK
jgi:glycolate oxidase